MKIFQAAAILAMLLNPEQAGAQSPGQQSSINFVLPEGTKIFYLDLTDSAGRSVSTDLVTLGKTTPERPVTKERMYFDPVVWLPPRVLGDAPDSLNYPNQRALYFSGLDYRGKETKVFSYLGFPANASRNSKVPGVVLVHGALGTAYPQWVKIWNDRGFAAIAMDLEGRQPPMSHHEMAGPSNTLFADSTELLHDQWLYHAVANVYLAYSFLASDPRVDKDRVGITGISWGGIITAIAIGNADCFAFAIPVYGCGYLHNSKGMYGSLYGAAVADLWDASHWLGTVTTPTLWMNSNADRIFSLDATSQSLRATKNSLLTILPNFPHSHVDGWSPPEIYAFANAIVKGEKGLIKITRQPAADDLTVEFDASDSPGFRTATLVYSTDSLSYNADSNLISRWLQSPLTVPELRTRQMIDSTHNQVTR